MAAPRWMHVCSEARFRPFVFVCDGLAQSANKDIRSIRHGSGYIQVAHGCTRPTVPMSCLVRTRSASDGLVAKGHLLCESGMSHTD